MKRRDARPRFIMALALAFLIHIPLSAAQTRFAVLVGHNLGSADEEPLQYAQSDATRMRDVLVDLGGVDPDNAQLLLNPTAADLAQALDRLASWLASPQHRGRQNTLLFYFAGHGDERTLHLGAETVVRARLEERLDKLPAQLKLATIDACQTRAVDRSKGVSAGGGFDIGIVRTEQQRGLVVIRSSSLGEPAHESDKLGGSVFTHYWISALRGGADEDRDGRVTLSEAYAFAYRNTVRHSATGSAVVQHPSFDIELYGVGELFLTESIRSAAMLILPPGAAASYLVYLQPQGTVVAEVIGSAKQPTALAVPSGEMVVSRREKERFSVAEVELPYGGKRALAPTDFADRPYEVMAARGSRLDLHPNGVDLEYTAGKDHLPSSWLLRQGPSLLYGLSLTRYWFYSVKARFAFSTYEKAGYHTEETLIVLSMRLGWRHFVGITTLELALGPQATFYLQDRMYLYPDRINDAGLYKEDRRNKTVGFGGELEIRWRIPLRRRWSIAIVALTAASAFRIADQSGESWRAVPTVMGGVSLGHRF